MKRNSISTEDFLKTIYHLEEGGKKANSAEMAAILEITPAAITDMSRKLKKAGLVLYTPYKPLGLTNAGRKLALGVIRRHRLWETFLYDVLGMEWNKVHDEAERLEHNTSDFLLSKLDEFLGFPAFDPHGDPIPDRQGRFPVDRDLICLRDISEKGDYTVFRIMEHSGQPADFLYKTGIEPGKKLVVDEIQEGGIMLIESDHKHIVLPGQYARFIYVKKQQ